MLNGEFDRREIVKVAAVAAIFSLLCATAQAQQSQEASVMNKLCMLTESMADAIMTNRQAGVRMSETLTKVKATLPSSPEFLADPVLSQIREQLESIATDMTIEAYDSPRYSVDMLRSDAVNEFASKHYSQCIQSLRKN